MFKHSLTLLALSVPAFFVGSGQAAEIVSPFTSLKGFDVKHSHIIKNLPPPTDQGSLPLCYAHAAATVYNYYVCKTLGQDCSSISRKELASPLDMTRFATPPADDGEMTYSSSYPNIRIEGGSALYVLEKAALFVGEVASQQCAPHEGFFIGVPDTGQGVADEVVLSQGKTLESLKAFYKRYGQSCNPQCPAGALEELAAILPSYHTDARGLANAARRDSFDGFLTRLAIPAECARAKNRSFFEKHRYAMEIVPKTGTKTLSYAGYRKAIIDAIKRDDPVILEGICLSAKKKNGKCDDNHSLVAYGYAELCDVKKCYTGLKLRSSWGPEWQVPADERWYDARELFDHSMQLEGMVGWLKAKPKPKS